MENFRRLKFRAEVDQRNEKLGLKIREAEIAKVPYILTIGKSEMENKTVSVRKYGGEQIGEIKLDDFLSIINGEIQQEDSL